MIARPAAPRPGKNSPGGTVEGKCDGPDLPVEPRGRALTYLLGSGCAALALMMLGQILTDDWSVRDSVLSTADRIAFIAHRESRLERFRDHFEAASEEFGVPWQLLAAIAYQESQWKPDATSRTGVRGLMMLTRTTAGAMGIDDRLDPAQSIHGGARYLSWLLARVPESVGQDTQTQLALASYNGGLQRIRNAWTASRSTDWAAFAGRVRSGDAGDCGRDRACRRLRGAIDYAERVRAFLTLF